MIQLNKKHSSVRIDLAKEIVSNHFNELTKKHYSKLLSRLDVSEEIFETDQKFFD